MYVFKFKGKLMKVFWKQAATYNLELLLYIKVRRSVAKKLINMVFAFFLHFACCSAKHGFVNCVQVTTRLKCRKEETIFITRIADTLSNTRVFSPHCKNINVTLCSSAERRQCLRTPILLMVLATTIVSICKLFYG